MSAFPFDAVIFDMDGVIVDTEYYYLGETAAFAKELGLNPVSYTHLTLPTSFTV